MFKSAVAGALGLATVSEAYGVEKLFNVDTLHAMAFAPRLYSADEE
mgnify:CR=1 FL=1